MERASPDWPGQLGVGSDSFRFHVLAEMIRQHSSDQDSVLEVGCGSGQLRRLLPHRRYHGFDLSRDEIEKAQAAFPADRWTIADGDTIVLHEQYDVIVFNESLYYLAPHAIWRYETMLRPSGIIAASIFRRGRFHRNQRVLRELSLVGPLIESVTIDADGVIWDLRIFSGTWTRRPGETRRIVTRTHR